MRSRLGFGASVLALLTCSNNPPVSPNCEAAKTACTGSCIDLSSDDSNCGSCGAVCDSTQACAGGQCLKKVCAAAMCSSAQVCVSNACAERSCVGVTCGTGQACVSGTCLSTQCQSTQCAAGFVCINEQCADTSCVGVLCPLGGACLAGACVTGSTPQTCSDGTKDGLETDIDCGGTCSTKCPVGSVCMGGADCASGRCVANACVAVGQCGDGMKDGTETDVDCGGSCANKCAVGKQCGSGADCTSGVCNGTCMTGGGAGGGGAGGGGGASGGGAGGGAGGGGGGGNSGSGGGSTSSQCTDGTMDGTETDTDCGGTCPAKCAVNKHCLVGADCQQKVCTGMVCQAATCTDGQANGSESDVDCGNACPMKCVQGQKCVIAADCNNNQCSSGTCGGSAMLCQDHLKDQDETDTDCGGTSCLPCTSGQHCLLPRDCALGFCNGLVCGTGFAAGVGPTSPVMGSITAGQINSNGDTFMDVAGTNANGGSVSVFLGDGMGGFGMPSTITLPTTQWTQISLVDLTGDGKVEMVLLQGSTPSTADFMVLKGNGNGTFQAPQTMAAVPQFAVRYAFGQFNADTIPDVAIVYTGGNYAAPGGVGIAIGNGDGTFQTPTIITLSGRTPMSTGCGSIVVADLNGDGLNKLDLAVGCGPNQVWILLGDGMGGFSVASTTPLVSGEPRLDLVAGLFNADTNVDLVTASFNSTQFSILKGNGNGTFQSASSYATGVAGTLVNATALDFNGDGHLDVLFPEVGQLEMFLGDGTGAFALGPTYPGTVNTLFVKDLNNDGQADLLTATPSGGFLVRLHQ